LPMEKVVGLIYWQCLGKVGQNMLLNSKQNLCHNQQIMFDGWDVFLADVWFGKSWIEYRMLWDSKPKSIWQPPACHKHCLKNISALPPIHGLNRPCLVDKIPIFIAHSIVNCRADFLADVWGGLERMLLRTTVYTLVYKWQHHRWISATQLHPTCL
jgi:hypothetical protein